MPPPDDLVLTLSTRAMGTRFELVLLGPVDVVGAAHRDDEAARRRATAQLRAIGEAAFDVIHGVEARWSLFLATSRLTQLNLRGHLVPVVLDQDDLELWRTVLAVRDASAGAFDPDVAHRMADLGFHGPADRSASLPDRTEPGLRGEVALEGRHLGLTSPGPALDLGGVAKGHALDLAARELEEAGIAAALLHAGTSSVVALGAPPGQAGWRVRAPGPAGSELTLVLRDRALSASRTDSQATHLATGHVLDPRTGQPVERPAQVVVTAPGAALADAWSTALCADPTGAAAARAMGVEVLLAGAPTAAPGELLPRPSTGAIGPRPTDRDPSHQAAAPTRPTVH